MITVTRRSILSGVVRSMDLPVTQAQLDEFALPGHQRRPVHDIFPGLSADEREFLMTGISPAEWDAMTDPES